MDRAGSGERVLAVGEDRRERRLVRDERPHVLRMLRDEGQRVDRAAAAGEEVDGPPPTASMTRWMSSACSSGVDRAGGVVLARCARCRAGRRSRSVRSAKWPASVPKPAAPIGEPMSSRGGSVLASLRRTS